MGKIIHVGGAKGVGKTTLLRELNGFRTPQGNSIKVVHMSQLLNELALHNHARELKQLGGKEKLDLRIAAADHVTSIVSDVVLLDSHCVDMREDKPVCIMPCEFEKIIDGYIVVVATPEEILTRRIKDAECRQRDLCINYIRNEIRSELVVANELAIKNGSEVMVVNNLRLPEATRDILTEVDLFYSGNYRSKEGGFGGSYENSIHHIER